MTRVLHVIRTDGLSGAERHLCILVEHLRGQGWDSDVLVSTRTPQGTAPLVCALQDAGAGVRVLPGPRDFDRHLLGALVRARRADRWSLLHTHLVHADWHGGLAADLAPGGTPLVQTKHNHDPFRLRPGVRQLERHWTRRADAVIAISGSLAGFVDDLTGRRPVTVRYGLPAASGDTVGRTAAAPAPTRSGDAPTAFVAVGRLEEQKGVDVLIDAAARTPGIHLEIVGDGSQRAALQSQIDRLGAGDRIRLAGHQSDVEARLHAADAFVHAARWEGFGLVLLEAMAAGRAVVATRVGAIPEVVDEGRTALLVAPDDPAALAAALAELRDDPGRRDALGAAGRQRLADAFSPERMAAETAAIYASVLEGRG